MIIKRIYILLLLSISMFLGCSKYEEGPAISLRKRENRLDGKWKIKTYTHNDIDSTTEFQSDRKNPEEIHFVWDSPILYVEYFRHPWLMSGSPIEQIGDFKYLRLPSIIEYGVHRPSLPPYKKIFLFWEIQRLSNKELWIVAKYGGNTYQIKLEKEDDYV